MSFNTFQSYDFLFTLAQVRGRVPMSYVLVYGLGNIILQGLNWLWFVKLLVNLCACSILGDRFYKMIDALKRRFFVHHIKLVDEMPGDDDDATNDLRTKS